MAYYQFENEDGEPHGSFEVFYASGLISDPSPLPSGWYWQACFPGCLPDDGDPIGPFESEEAAIENARNA